MTPGPLLYAFARNPRTDFALFVFQAFVAVLLANVAARWRRSSFARVVTVGLIVCECMFLYLVFFTQVFW